MAKSCSCSLLQAVATTEEPDVQSRCESQAGGGCGDEGLHVGLVDTGAHVGLSRAALWPRASGSKNMTTAQNGHGRVAAIPCSASDTTDPSMVTYPACQNGGCAAGDAEAQDAGLGPAKFVRLFSVSRKRAGAAERPRSVVLMGHSSTWNALASFRKMGSFKKLKSSVLQGIQNREGSDAAKEAALEPDLGPALPNGAAGPASDGSDPEEADDAFQRSTHRSRSLRRAYGLGRISLRDSEPPGGPSSPVAREPRLCAILVRDAENNSIAYRRSKSTDNLNFLRKSSFKRKSASNLADLRVAPERPAPRRTLSSCSADSEKLGGSERRPRRWKSPIRAKDFDRVLRLVSGATDAAWKRERPKARGDSQEPKPGSQFTLGPEQPPTPLRPTAPKPPSPQSPGAGSAKCPSNLSALSLSSADSDERADGLVSFPESVQATCDKGTEDSGSSSHPQLSLGGASGPEEKEEISKEALCNSCEDTGLAASLGKAFQFC
ncbi:PREDICTED: uncharacterized protein LOC107546411 [Miniopterus natalensis]|uniref:uncharacterized protein LOC107546411 n=1 Tax=Miniopterus natalensis TaxID=291302 RepID=UPI0007A6C4F8|nr:PREDICTED: uncharacterized protein LOC107546411 [Miniopterus natalensis]